MQSRVRTPRTAASSLTAPSTRKEILIRKEDTKRFIRLITEISKPEHENNLRLQEKKVKNDCASETRKINIPLLEQKVDAEVGILQRFRKVQLKNMETHSLLHST